MAIDPERDRLYFTSFSLHWVIELLKFGLAAISYAAQG